MKDLLKFITCGSVDDGKSTLIGRLLYDSKLIYADQESRLVMDSKIGSRDKEIDYSLLLDGLMAEREQGITIDVAYRYFNTTKRSFIVADTPGHEEYTRNMAVGASFADLAIILIDASKGILVQTKRHLRICQLMGIDKFVFAINKMDLINYDHCRYIKIELEIKKIMKSLLKDDYYVIPVSATEGDNITKFSQNMDWFNGETLLGYLENVDLSKSQGETSFLMPIQRVSRPNLDFRGFQGQIAQGSVRIGEEIKVLPSGEKAEIEKIFVTDKEANSAKANEAVTLVLNREVDCSRGSVVTKNDKLATGRLFRCDLLWMDDEELFVGGNYMLKIATKVILATIIKIHYCIDVNTGEHILQKQAKKNDIINCDISLSEKIVFEKFEECKPLGRFILINRVSNMTAACGVIKYRLHRSDNLTWQHLDITKEIRSRQKNQKAKTLWFTGLSGSGKSTIVNALEKALFISGKHTMILDGDNVRMGLNNNLGFSHADRAENIRRIAEAAKLMNDAGLIVLVSAISPYAADRENAKMIIGKEFIEIYVNTSIEECIKRDTKGLYKKAMAGEISNFTGISAPYEPPTNSDFVAQTEKYSVDEITEQLLRLV